MSRSAFLGQSVSKTKLLHIDVLCVFPQSHRALSCRGMGVNRALQLQSTLLMWRNFCYKVTTCLSRIMLTVEFFVQWLLGMESKWERQANLTISAKHNFSPSQDQKLKRRYLSSCNKYVHIFRHACWSTPCTDALTVIDLQRQESNITQNTCSRKETKYTQQCLVHVWRNWLPSYYYNVN